MFAQADPNDYGVLGYTRNTQHTLYASLCVAQQIWFGILQFSGKKVHFRILCSLLLLGFFILASISGITKNHNSCYNEDICGGEMWRRSHIYTKLKHWYNWTHGVPVSLHSCTGWQMGLLLLLLARFRHLWTVLGMIITKIKNTIYYFNAFNSSEDESAVVHALTFLACVYVLCFLRIM